MSEGRKFIFLVLPAIAAFLLIALLALLNQDESLKDHLGMFGILVTLLVGNLVLYRRHVDPNGWLGPANRARMKNAVTMYGPFAQLIYYMMQIHPRKPGDRPPSNPEDTPHTDADTIAGI